MIRAPSLVPAPRVFLRKKKRRVRGWGAALALLVLTGSAGTALARVWISDPNAASNDDIADAERLLDELAAQRDTLRIRAAAAAATLRAARAASDHPDWSILLAYISDLCGERITLNSFTLEPVPDSDGFDIRIRGSGRSQQDVAVFVLGLEDAGVFSSTRLEQSGGQITDAGVPFTVVCLIRTARPAGGAG